MKPSQNVIIKQMQLAQKKHGQESLLTSFISGLQGDHPRYSNRVSRGVKHVCKSGSIRFQNIPDFHAEMPRLVVEGDTASTKYHYFSARHNGMQFDPYRTVIAAIELNQIKWSRYYMKPVQVSGRSWSKSFLSIIISTALIGGFLPSRVIASSNPKTVELSQESPVLMATAYTDSTLPTLQRGDRSSSVRLLQQILLDNGLLGAAAVRLGNLNGIAVDGIFGPVTESAVRDLQQRYNIPVTGQVDPLTWAVLDMQLNPYRSPLPWK